MASGVGQHSIPQTVFAVQPAKGQTESAVEQEATEQNHRGQLAKDNEGVGQMPGGEEEGRQ